VQPLSLDRLRQELFTIRDQLFDFAVDGGIDFTDPIYRELRNDINGLILFAHKISVTRLLISGWLIEPEPVVLESIQRWRAAVDKLPSMQRRKLMELRHSSLKALFSYMRRRSAVLWIGMMILSMVDSGADRLRSFVFVAMPKMLEPLEAQARAEYRLAS
jgi:hypothetical protein